MYFKLINEKKNLFSDANLTSGYSVAEVVRFQCLLLWLCELIVRFKSDEPETGLGVVVVARAAVAVTLDEWRRAEVLQARARVRQ